MRQKNARGEQPSFFFRPQDPRRRETLNYLCQIRRAENVLCFP